MATKARDTIGYMTWDFNWSLLFYSFYGPLLRTFHVLCFGEQFWENRGEGKPAYGPKIREIHEHKEISNMKLLASGSNQENRLQIKQRYK